VPPGEELAAAYGYAARLLACAPTSLRAIKACARDTAGLPLAEAFAASLAHQRRALGAADVAEGLAAFAEGREPTWSGS
jgi:enoyl-CoA hydratase/carnithine racemase